MPSLAVAALCALAVLVAFAYHAWRARCKLAGQRAVYALASARARATGKPLVVVGDPAAPGTLNAVFGAGYGCGDLCVDVAGAPSCPRALAAPVLEWARSAPDDSAVVFESEVLMYVPREELAETLRELRRASGGDLFSAHSNVVNAAAYARDGISLLKDGRRPDLRREPRLFDVVRLALPTPGHAGVKRAFYEYPPFSDRYAWVEFSANESALD